MFGFFVRPEQATFYKLHFKKALQMRRIFDSIVTLASPDPHGKRIFIVLLLFPTHLLLNGTSLVMVCYAYSGFNCLY